jgi:hypothetical protein
MVNHEADLSNGSGGFELGDGGGDAVVHVPTSQNRDLGHPRRWIWGRSRSAFETGECEHFCDEVFEAFSVGEGTLVANLIFIGRAGLHGGELQR